MKAEDLRIGNLVYPDMSYPEPVTVCAKDFEDTTYLKPIPLTEEWLLKFGFVEHPLDWYRLKDFSICLKENGRCVLFWRYISHLCVHPPTPKPTPRTNRRRTNN